MIKMMPGVELMNSCSEFLINSHWPIYLYTFHTFFYGAKFHIDLFFPLHATRIFIIFLIKKFKSSSSQQGEKKSTKSYCFEWNLIKLDETQ